MVGQLSRGQFVFVCLADVGVQIDLVFDGLDGVEALLGDLEQGGKVDNLIAGAGVEVVRLELNLVLRVSLEAHGGFAGALRPMPFGLVGFPVGELLVFAFVEVNHVGEGQFVVIPDACHEALVLAHLVDVATMALIDEAVGQQDRDEFRLGVNAAYGGGDEVILDVAPDVAQVVPSVNVSGLLGGLVNLLGHERVLPLVALGQGILLVVAQLLPAEFGLVLGQSVLGFLDLVHGELQERVVLVVLADDGLGVVELGGLGLLEDAHAVVGEHMFGVVVRHVIGWFGVWLVWLVGKLCQSDRSRTCVTLLPKQVPDH